MMVSQVAFATLSNLHGSPFLSMWSRRTIFWICVLTLLDLMMHVVWKLCLFLPTQKCPDGIDNNIKYLYSSKNESKYYDTDKLQNKWSRNNCSKSCSPSTTTKADRQSRCSEDTGHNHIDHDLEHGMDV